MSISEEIKKLHANGHYDEANEARRKNNEALRLSNKMEILKAFGCNINYRSIETANNWLIRNNHIELVDISKVRVDATLGYEYVYSPDHPLANKSGKLYYHRYIASLCSGRYVTDDEIVHHKNENRSDNTCDNLEVLTPNEHAIHHFTDHAKVYVMYTCPNCKNDFEREENNNSNNYCSTNCASLDKRKFNPTKEELQKLVWEMSTVQLGKHFGVSDKAVEKRCKLFNIEKPPRGYWAKKAAGKL